MQVGKVILSPQNCSHTEVNNKINSELTLESKEVSRLVLRNCTNTFTVFNPVCRLGNSINVEVEEVILDFVAVGAIEKYDCVSTLGGTNVEVTDISASNYSKWIGVALESVADGEPVKVKITGIIYDPTWNWDTSKEVWCDVNGKLTQTPINTSGFFVLQVADVLTENMIVVARFKPVLF